MTLDDHTLFEEMMRLVEVAERNVAAGGGPFAAIVMKDDFVVGSGVNTVHSSHDPTAHAEIAAIRDAGRRLGTHDLSGCRLLTSCYPCPMCLGATLWSRIGELYYAATTDQASMAGFDDGAFYRYLGVEERIIDTPSGILTITRIDVPNAGSPFDAWIRTPTAPRY